MLADEPLASGLTVYVLDYFRVPTWSASGSAPAVPRVPYAGLDFSTNLKAAGYVDMGSRAERQARRWPLSGTEGGSDASAAPSDRAGPVLRDRRATDGGTWRLRHAFRRGDRRLGLRQQHGRRRQRGVGGSQTGFDITLYAALSGVNTPVLRFSNLQLKLTAIDAN